MRFSTRTAKIIFTITALVLLVLSSILYIQINDVVHANKDINSTNNIRIHLEKVFSSAKDAETAQRGFLLTRDTLFLQPYWGAFQRISISFSDLYKNVHGEEQKQNLVVLDSMIKSKFASFEVTIRKFNEAGTDAARKNLLREDKASMDNIRKQFQKMESAELRRADDPTLTTITKGFLAPVSGILLIFLSLGVLGVSYYKITQDLKRLQALVDQMKKLNTELTEKNRELEITNEELDSFNYISSHDLQEPVRKIRTFASIIEATDYDKFTEKNKYNFQRLQHSAVRIQDLLQDLLIYSQLGKGQQHFELIPLKDAIEDAKTNMDVVIEQAKATITYENLPVVRGVHFQLEQLFENLINNSIKYKHLERAPNIHITCTHVETANKPEDKALILPAYYKISVRDNGIGFDQRFVGKIFEPFSRLHSKQGYSGTGIGLTICKKIVHNHSGIIRAQSVVDEGTTIIIYLPVPDPSINQ
jgi:signal transduction histidine kinase